MIPSENMMYEIYTNNVNYDLVEIDYIFDHHEIFLKDMEQIMITNVWNSDEIKKIYNMPIQVWLYLILTKKAAVKIRPLLSNYRYKTLFYFRIL